jgi:outer membrane protein
MRTSTIAGIALLALSAPVFGQAGTTSVQLGWFHLHTMEDDHPLETSVTPSPFTEAYGIPTEFTSEGTGASVNDSNTVALLINHFFTDHWAVEFAGGIPAKFDITGKGMISLSGDPDDPLNVNLGSDQNNPLAKVKQWSPTLLVQYHFLQPSAKLRPYVGVGLTYTWFTDIKLDEDFQASVNNGLGALLAAGAGESGPVHTSADAKSDWAPVLNAGARYLLNEHWSIVGSATYLPLETTATIKIKADSGATLAESKADLGLDTLVTLLTVQYSF